jgi:SAM-dependent methyltransferase
MSAGRQEDDRAALWSRPVNAQTGSGRSEEDAPLPPLEIAGRAGPIASGDFRAHYKEVGRLCREAITDRLPEDWTWEGKRALDFGCGAGRVLRHFLPESDRCLFHGCDIDEPALAWAIEHLSPPFELFASREMPPLRRPDASFDLVWAMSVFTHLEHESWSAWLLELHRVLKPGGILIAFLQGPAPAVAARRAVGRRAHRHARSRRRPRVVSGRAGGLPLRVVAPGALGR